MKRKYISPEFVYSRVELYEILTSSVENYSGYVDPDPGDWGDDPIIPDDDIIW